MAYLLSPLLSTPTIDFTYLSNTWHASSYSDKETTSVYYIRHCYILVGASIYKPNRQQNTGKQSRFPHNHSSLIHKLSKELLHPQWGKIQTQNGKPTLSYGMKKWEKKMIDCWWFKLMLRAKQNTCGPTFGWRCGLYLRHLPANSALFR